MYQGYLIKIGNYIFPLSAIEGESYSAKVNTLDEDSYNDANGKLHRTVIQKIPKINFETLPLTESELRPIMTNIQQNYSIADERKASVSAWIPELGEYVVQDMYISDIDFNIDTITKNDIEYKPIKFTLTGYGV